MGKIDDLYITVPSFFRCPISLDVMKSPVNLCTGVTYDRTSIQRWLENGNNTCPATMQVLDTKDFVPNHTLQRLIQIWSNNHHLHRLSHSHSSTDKQSSSPTNNYNTQFHSISSALVLDLIKRFLLINEEGNQFHASKFDDHDDDDERLFESFVKILCFASESDDNTRFLGSNEQFVDHLIKIVLCEDPDLNPDLVEAVLNILHLIIALNDSKMIQKISSSCELVSALTRILRTGRPGSRVAAAGIIETFAKNPESKKPVFEHQHLVLELLQVLKHGTSREISQDEIQAVLSCLISLSSTRTNKLKLVRAGGVKIVGEIISSPQNKNGTIIELLMTVLEMLAGCTEGRVALSNDPNGLPMVINKIMKVSKLANEHGVALLWSLCYLFRDQKAKEVVMRSNGGLTKILLLMQSDCSPAVKRMCCDLLRIFRVNSKSCLSSYDTKTTHIMPC